MVALYRTPHEVAFRDAEQYIQDGWIALYKGKEYVSQIIRYFTGGPYSHVGMLRKNGDRAEVMEMVFKGGVVHGLQCDVESYPGQIDVYSYDKLRYPEADPEKAVERMEELVRNKYGWKGVFRLGAMRLPFVWRLFPLTMDDLAQRKGAPFCSHAVADAWHIGGGIDPVPRKPFWMTTPGDLCWSMFFNYEFTLK